MTPVVETPKKRRICVVYDGQLPAICIEADTICKEQQRTGNNPRPWTFTFKREGESEKSIATYSLWQVLLE